MRIVNPAKYTSMNQYIVTVNHDNGKVKIRTHAQDEITAKSIVIAAEGCPERAIQSVRKITTKKKSELVWQRQ